MFLKSQLMNGGSPSSLWKLFETNYSPDVQHVPEELMITKYFDLHGFCGDLMNLITATKSDVQHVPDELMTMKYF